LDEEIHFNKKLISEMIHIKKQFKGLNLQKKKKKKTELLGSIYSDVIGCSMSSPTPFSNRISSSLCTTQLYYRYTTRYI